MANCFLLLACLFFSFACNLVKKIYDDLSYHNTSAMLCSAAISGLSGFIFALVLSEFFSSPLAVVGLAGIGGFFGTKAINAIVKTRVGSRLIAEEELQELLIENNDGDEEQELIDNLTDTIDDSPGTINDVCETISHGLHSVDNHVRIRVVRHK